jgi:hypothetical protein
LQELPSAVLNRSSQRRFAGLGVVRPHQTGFSEQRASIIKYKASDECQSSLGVNGDGDIGLRGTAEEVLPYELPGVRVKGLDDVAVGKRAANASDEDSFACRSGICLVAQGHEGRTAARSYEDLKLKPKSR